MQISVSLNIMKKTKIKPKKRINAKVIEDTPNTAREKRAVRALVSLSEDPVRNRATSVSTSDYIG